ncbi:L,D-transpeptidase family protein [Halanaerobium hydrogeniformans]|uniref:L,D-transpeptidase family protein n=1 Tax=Halanaerobium hydrogeniformans TaxID=656519 RepID=UPI001EE68B72|nr:L,D-transpeptidase family protein [Halanaerobium hydrogeniformans]
MIYLKRRTLAIFIFILILFFSSNTSADINLNLSIRNHLVVLEDRDGQFPEDQKANYYQELFDFYENNDYKPVWLEEDGFSIEFEKLLKEIEASYYEGLNPEDYHLEFIQDYIAKNDIFAEENTNKRAVIDIYLSDAYFSLATDYLSGKLDPEVILEDGDFSRNRIDNSEIFEGLKSENITVNLQSKLPESDYYQRLKHKLYIYRDSGEVEQWPEVDSGSLLAQGAEGIRVSQLSDNLINRGYLSEENIDDKYYFGSQLNAAVKEFQFNHGLSDDGIVGPQTLEALNIPYEKRIKQIMINMERWRWLPKDLGERYIYVNISDYSLNVYEDNNIIMNMKTIVGNEQRSTPVFSDEIRYLVFNPYWYVPKSIAVEDILPSVKNDIDYLDENNYKIFAYNNNNTLRKIDASEIEWENIDEDNFNFLVRQEPGDENALGRVKFMFPNRFNVYLHDTPSKYLFDETERGFSSGCIRIEKPIELALYLLKDQEEWDRETLEEIMKEDNEKTIYLDETIPIYLQYNTAWVDNFGNLNFRKDIYNRDKILIEHYFEN